MAIVRNRAELVLAAAMRENPELAGQLTISNCFVYKYGAFSPTKGSCTIKGRYGLGIRSKVSVKYTKLDLVTMLIGLVPTVNVSGAASTVALLPAINARYGFDLKPEEIVDRPLEEDGTKAVIEVLPTCSLYKGTVTFAVGPQPVSLDTLVVERSVDIKIDVWPSGDRINGSTLSLGHDYTAVAMQLGSISGDVLADADATALAGWLKSIDNVPWTATANSAYSLMGAKVVYNGRSAAVPVELSPAAKVLFSDVLIIEPSKDLNTNMAATPVAFHYNVFI